MSTSVRTLLAPICSLMKKLRHEFVEYMPRVLEEGVLYVSIRFRIASHKCFCGCGNEVVTNLSPDGWQLTYDGQTISLHPSIGNLNLTCRSHYWIIRDTVRWAQRLPERKIQQAKRPKGKVDLEGTRAVATKPSKAGSKSIKALWAKLIGD
jgi:hypothetical protein